MDNNSNETINMLLKYSSNLPPCQTVGSELNTYVILSRGDTPFIELSDKICRRLRKQKDDFSLTLARGFISMHKQKYIPSHRLVDPENIEIFELYYVDHLNKNDIMKKFCIEDERTFYKKLKRSRELFAMSIYHFCMFINQ